jgi:leucyl-tRNA synthetase
MKFMQGYNVLHPMGFDAFGLPAENEAINNKTHPAPMIERYARRYKEQMDLIGVSYDWSRSFSSSDPSYYKWTQWIFEVLYKRGLAYQKEVAVNWDPVDKTVLADEEVINGRAERSKALVEKKLIPQWLFKITAYGERLIDDLDDLDWPDGIKNQQRNWIGRSYGVEFELKVEGTGDKGQGKGYDLDSEDSPVPSSRPSLSFRVFTTRIDTVFGMTFCVLSPEHPLVD